VNEAESLDRVARCRLLLSPASGASAEDWAENPFGRPGFYLSAGPSCGVLDDQVRGEVANSEGFNGRIGIRLGPRVAFETELEFIVDFDRSSGSGRS
jgi:hypothetical protein